MREARVNRLPQPRGGTKIMRTEQEDLPRQDRRPYWRAHRGRLRAAGPPITVTQISVRHHSRWSGREPPVRSSAHAHAELRSGVQVQLTQKRRVHHALPGLSRQFMIDAWRSHSSSHATAASLPPKYARAKSDGRLLRNVAG